MNKKVIVVAPETNGGINAVVANLIKGGINKYNNIVIHASTYESTGIKKLYLDSSQFIKAIFLFVNDNSSIIHIHTSTKGSFYRKSLYLLLGKIFRIKIIIHIHPTHFIDFLSSSGKIQKKFILKILCYADLIIVLSSQALHQLEKFDKLKNKKIISLRNPIFLNDYPYGNMTKRKKNILLYLGWIIKKKGVYDLLDAAPLVKKKIKDFQLIFCGNKETEKLRRMVHQLNLDGYVKVKDWVGLEEKKILLQNSTALILPTYTEGIPNVILEAMASGIPIITTPVGGIPSVLTENVNCLFFQPGNINEMAKKIEFLFKNKRLRHKLSLHNLEKIKQYNSVLIIEKLYTIYKKL